MDIECKIKREGGTHVDMGSAQYHFTPNDDGAHVAEVLDEAHQDRFLSIPEAYRLYRGTPAAAPVSAPAVVKAAEPAPEVLLGSDNHPASFEIHGKTYALGEIVAAAHKASGLDVAEWNELDAESRAGLIDDELDKLDEAGAELVDEDALRAELVAQFEAKFGKKPHHNAGIETIRAKLAEG
jgi:hypothetical protein